MKDLELVIINLIRKSTDELENRWKSVIYECFRISPELYKTRGADGIIKDLEKDIQGIIRDLHFDKLEYTADFKDTANHYLSECRAAVKELVCKKLENI